MIMKLLKFGLFSTVLLVFNFCAFATNITVNNNTGGDIEIAIKNGDNVRTVTIHAGTQNLMNYIGVDTEVKVRNLNGSNQTAHRYREAKNAITINVPQTGTQNASFH